jgi:hypothetical protein
MGAGYDVNPLPMTLPADTQFKRKPNGPHSAANVFIIFSIPARAAPE